ncbi:glycosyltransferase family 2 protein [Desulforamulus ruminis]|uniref:glycosyltransferase family 2 protein n=1 Tax=Desulforamulus ruminis TaxID=1564 RepID=UPI002FD936FC
MFYDNISPDLSLIIVTYNSEEFIMDCLMSVQNQTCRNFETIIVDNGSIDETTTIIEKYFPWVQLIKSHKNLGFTGGVHLGYTHSKGKYIALLNPDTRAHNEWLANLVFIMNGNQQCGICASLMLKWGTNIVDTAGDGCTCAGKGYKIGHNLAAEFYQDTKEVFAACGGAVLYRRKMIEEVGFFDSDFFLLHEDTDLSFRARLEGWSCIYVSNAVVEHKVSASIGYKSSLAVYHSVKNSDMVWLKNMPGLFLLFTLHEKLLSDISSFIYLGIIHGKIKEYIKAKMFIFNHFSQILAKRKVIQGKRKIGYKQLYNYLTPFLSPRHLSSLWKEKSNEIIPFKKSGGGPNKAGRINNHTHS